MRESKGPCDVASSRVCPTDTANPSLLLAGKTILEARCPSSMSWCMSLAFSMGETSRACISCIRALSALIPSSSGILLPLLGLKGKPRWSLGVPSSTVGVMGLVIGSSTLVSCVEALIGLDSEAIGQDIEEGVAGAFSDVSLLSVTASGGGLAFKYSEPSPGPMRVVREASEKRRACRRTGLMMNSLTRLDIGRTAFP